MDPWSKLIRRAQAFRDALVRASEDASAAGSGSANLTVKDGEKNRKFFQGSLLENLLAEESSCLPDREGVQENLGGEGGGEGEEEHYAEEEEGEDSWDMNNCTDLEQENPGDVAEEALLQELFFPANKKLRFSSSLKQHAVADALLDRNTVCLTVNVGKLILCQGVRNALHEMVTDVGTDTLLSSCLLTLIFPVITAERVEVGSSPEQCISIRPIKGNGHEFVFDHHSQLFWKLPLNQDLSSIWNAQQMMKASIEVVVGDGEVLHGNAYLSLQNVVNQRPAALQLNMVLVRCDTSSRHRSMHSSNAKQEQKSCTRKCQRNSIPTLLIQDAQKPLAMLEVGLKLVHDVGDRGNALLLKNLAPTTEEAWLYVYIPKGLSTIKGDSLHERRKSLILMIKSGNQSVLRLFFKGSLTAKIDYQLKVMGGRFADALLMSPDPKDISTIFLEVWCNPSGLLSGRNDGLQNLIGLAKVPLCAVVDQRESPEKSILDGFFSLWHPRSDAKGQKLRITVYRGSKTEMLRVLQENRSAEVIQRHCRLLLERLHKKKLRKRHESNGGSLLQGETLRHVFEVTVQRAKHIPVEKLSNNGCRYNCRGVFIKYIFPGEDDPLFTHIRRLFDLPIKFHKWVECEEKTSNLTVQVAYDRVDLAESHLLDGTIFYNQMSASHLQLKSLLEVMVLDVKINQAELHTTMPHKNVSSIRFSLFPCNRELESKYPPIMTYLDEMAYQLKSTFMIMLDMLIIKELWESYMTFEVWQQRPQAHESFSSTSIEGRWIGVAIAPCVMLISQRDGVCGWIDLVGLNKQSVGCLKVSVKFLRWHASSRNEDHEINVQPTN
ncbi:hypothetical protein GOP47_0018841 [Adiantum capillus-veneris]|uniref:Uncharacterized protein n=1 Tax=Adiantum capillus-veneris TaxID=13818 RepID=A0A9D4ZA00_ADICA|nr:hypothetical protein GOP47_0018841 [Adiantum capillus-veneris]